MQFFKKHKKIILLVSVMVFFEIALRMFWVANGEFRHNPLNSKFAALSFALKQKPKFYQDRFCDSMHQTKTGEQDFAKCVYQTVNPIATKTENKILAVGASTTHGFSCESETSWPNEFSLLDKKFNVLNIADDGGYSDESIIKVEAQLQQNKIPDILIWGHGFTEFLFYGNERDINWETLKQDQPLIDDLHKERVYKENTILKILRLDITIQKYSFLYRFIRNKTNIAILNIQNGYIKFVMANSSEEKSKFNEREDYLANSGFLGGPVRMLFSEATQNYAVKNYQLNLKRLSDLSKKYNFKVVCIKVPNVDGLLEFFSKDFGMQFDNWTKKIAAVTDETCRKLNFEIADVNQCYQKMAENEK